MGTPSPQIDNYHTKRDFGSNPVPRDLVISYGDSYNDKFQAFTSLYESSPYPCETEVT